MPQKKRETKLFNLFICFLAVLFSLQITCQSYLTVFQVLNSGRYTCEAKNKAGMVEQDILLYVMSKFRLLDILEL